jgi:hypothetical protein
MRTLAIPRSPLRACPSAARVARLDQGGFQNPVAAAEHRRENREKRASCLSPRRVVCARRVRRAPIFPRSAGRGRRLRGALSFGRFSLGKQRKATCRGSATHKQLLIVREADSIEATLIT